jgi:hypothetical protein
LLGDLTTPPLPQLSWDKKKIAGVRRAAQGTKALQQPQLAGEREEENPFTNPHHGNVKREREEEGTAQHRARTPPSLSLSLSSLLISCLEMDNQKALFKPSMNVMASYNIG